MFKLHRMLLAGAILAIATSATQAAEVNGILVVASSGSVTSTGSNLSSSTAVISIPRLRANAPGEGDFSGVDEPDLLGTNVTLNVAQASDGFGFTFTGEYGTFVADLGNIVTQTADFLNVYIEGVFTPAGVVTGDPGRASLNVTLTYLNGRYSLGGVLNAPPTPMIPEPSSIALAGIGLASAGLFGLRKRASK